MLDDVADYDGIHGLFVHAGADGTYFVKLAYHEGLVDSGTWLAVQDKKSRNHKIPNNGTALNSWLVGLVKCAHCGYGLQIIYRWNASHTKQWRYYLDCGAYRVDGCIRKRLHTKPDTVEQAVFEAMKKRINTLEIAKKERSKPNAESEKINAEIFSLDDEIRCLMDRLSKADEVLFDYIQTRIKELHNKKSELEKKLRQRERKHKEIDTSPLADPLSRWEELTVQEKHDVAVTMVDVVKISDETGIDIRFSI